VITALLLALTPAFPFTPALAQDPIGKMLDEYVAADRGPGVSVAIARNDGSVVAWSRGFEDPESKSKLMPTHHLMSGSIGKTYFAALAMQLIDEKRISPDDLLSKYLGKEEWYSRLPNAKTITLGSLMRHTSGMVDHIAMPALWQELEKRGQEQWTREELLAYLLDQEPQFAVDTSWAYADANYILLGMALEVELQETVYREVWKRFLLPLGLKETYENNSADLPGLAQGWRTYGVTSGEPQRVLQKGRFYINPQMEWCGGGYRSTTSDLAKWGAALYGGNAISAPARKRMIDAAVDAQLWPGDRYGFGVIVSKTPQGPSWGHSGFFPGYLSEMMWFPELECCIAVQFNTDNMRKAGHPRQMLMQIAAIVADDD
jgi:D-alanyl-D-alanine carboxypeptidase